MSGPGVPGDDMPIIPRLTQPETSQAQEAAMEALLAGTALPPHGPDGLRPVTDVLTALRDAASGDELAGEMAALAHFRQRAAAPATPARSQLPWSRRSRRPRRDRPLLTPVLGARAAMAAMAAVVGFGGIAAAAAYTGRLPGPIQRFAHSTIGAPAGPSGQAVGPAPAGSPGHGGRRRSTGWQAGQSRNGLCTAYEKAATDAQRSAAFRALVQAAGGAGRVAAYCAAVPGPRPTPSHRSPSHGKGRGNPQGNGGGQGRGSGTGKGRSSAAAKGGGSGNLVPASVITGSMPAGAKGRAQWGGHAYIQGNGGSQANRAGTAVPDP